MIRRPPRSTLFPYTPLSRSDVEIAFARPDLVFDIIEPLIRDIFAVIGRNIETPFPGKGRFDVAANHREDVACQRLDDVEHQVGARERDLHVRSGERRVGEECRSRWSPYHLKKKKRK